MFHRVPAPFSINQPPVALESSVPSSWGTPRISETSESSNTGGSASVSAARSSNGEQGTGPSTANRTDTGVYSQGTKTKSTKSVKSVTIASSGKRGRPTKLQPAKETAVTPAAEDQQGQTIDIDREQRVGRAPSPARENQTQAPSYLFADTQEPLQFNATSNFNRSISGINFQPTPATATVDTTDSMSKIEKARARTAKAREARAKKRSEEGSQTKSTEITESAAKRRSTRISELVEWVNQEQSELSSELEEVNMEELECRFRQDQSPSLPEERYIVGDFQPSSSLPERTGTVSRKRKQLHSDSISLNIRPSGQRKTPRRKSAISVRQ